MKKKWPIVLIVIGGAALLLGMRQRRRSVRDEREAMPIPGRAQTLERYPPNSPELVALLADATEIAGVPQSWAGHPDLHYIIEHESQGWVGRPNYTYGQGGAGERFGADISSPSARARWPQVWAELRGGTKGARSTATGIGQFILDNVRLYYPAGVDGIGVPLDEAVGVLRYVSERYGTPEAAARFKRDMGWW